MKLESDREYVRRLEEYCLEWGYSRCEECGKVWAHMDEEINIPICPECAPGWHRQQEEAREDEAFNAGLNKQGRGVFWSK